MTAPTVTDVRHPAWCSPASCEVEPSGLGDHLTGSGHLRLVYGSEILLRVVAEHLARRSTPKVALRIPLTQDEAPEGTSEERREALGQHHQLEPEEARLLARFLIEAAEQAEAGRLTA